MKLLLVHNRYLYPGGEDEVFAAESALLRRQGCEVVEYVEENRRLDRLGKANTALRALWSFPAQDHLRRIVSSHGPAVAHFHNTFPLISPSGYYACHRAGVPVVQTLHNYRLLCAEANLFRQGQVCELCVGRRLTWPGIIHRCYHRSLAQSAVVTSMLGLHRLLGTWKQQVDVFIAPSQFARRKFIQGGLPAERIVVKPGFVHPDPGAREGSGDYALFVGRLSPEKGVEVLLQAWRLLPGVPLLVAGDGPLLESARAFAASGAAGEGVRVLGRCPPPQVQRLMMKARYLVFPSQCYETFAMVIAESFACGLPVVAFELGAAAEIVEHGRTGLLARPGEAQDLAEKAAWLWSHPAEARRMGREARAEFEAKYGAQRNYSRLMEIYQAALEAGKRRPA